MHIVSGGIIPLNGNHFPKNGSVMRMSVCALYAGARADTSKTRQKWKNDNALAPPRCSGGGGVWEIV